MPDVPAGERGATLSNRYVVAVLIVVMILVYILRYALLPFAAAVAVAYASTSIIRQLQRLMPRGAAVLVVYFTILGIIVAVGVWVATSLAERLLHTLHELPDRIGQIVQEWAGPQIHMFGETIPSNEVGQRLIHYLGVAIAQPDHAMMVGGVVVIAPTAMILTLVLLFYFLHSGRRVAEGVLWLAPPRYRGEIRALAARVDPALRRYVIGVFLIVTYTATTAWVFLTFIFHIPYSYVIAVIVGVLELVPVIGPAISMAILIGTALLEGHDLIHTIGLGLFAIALRLSIDEGVGPLLLGRAVTLHPVVVIFAFLTGASLFGILGVLFAVPVATAAKIVLGAWYGEASVLEKRT